MKVLIVEDEDVLLRVIKEKLENEKFEVGVAISGDGVLNTVKSFMPDMILLDLLLPKVSGLEVLSLIKKDDDLKNIPIIVLSNLSDSENINKALKIGAVDYLVKTEHPINEVVEMINKHILKAR